MQRGLVLGKFMPVHKGHIQLIEFAQSHCDELIVWVCVSELEPISAELRINWVEEIFVDNTKIRPLLFVYDESKLPNTSESSEEISKIWAEAIRHNLPKIDLFFSAEPYGEFVADFLACKHVPFPKLKGTSASQIRKNPWAYWQDIPDNVKPFFYKKVAIVGTESTGKTILTKRLAKHFDSDFVSEAGREIVSQTEQCKWEDLLLIAKEHARQIEKKAKALNKLLFVDTDISITQSYAKFLFNRELDVEEEVRHANECDLYLFLWNDCPFIQDGTRLEKSGRDKLQESHLQQLELNNIEYKIIKGDWHNRFLKVLECVNELYK